MRRFSLRRTLSVRPQTVTRAVRLSFDVPAGDLVEALDAFRHTTGVQVHSNISTDKLVGFRSRGAKGTLTPEQALRQILRETGLQADFKQPNQIEISIRNTDQVSVTTSVAEVGMQQFQQALVDTAQSINVVPQYILSEQADTTLRDSLRNVPGISIAAGEGGAQGDSLTISRFYRAQRHLPSTAFATSVLTIGTASTTTRWMCSKGRPRWSLARGSTGGVVNQESKQPELRRFVITNGQGGTNDRARGTLDYNQPIDAIPGGTAFRLNIVGEQTGYAGRDVANTHRWGVAPSIAFGLSKHTRGFVSYLHEVENDIPDYGLPYFGASYPLVPTNTYYGIASANFLKTNPDVVTGKIEHDFGLHITLRNTLRWANYPRSFRITEPQVNSAAVAIFSNADGKNVYEGVNTKIAVQCAVTATPSTSCYPFNTPLSQVFIKRNEINGISNEGHALGSAQRDLPLQHQACIEQCRGDARGRT